MSEPTPPSPTRIDPPRVVALLQREGWRVAGAREGSYVRLAAPGAGSPSVLVPLDVTAPDFDELFEAASRTIVGASGVGEWSTSPIARAMLVSAFDKFEFRKESSAPSGFIPWSQGEELFTAARAALASAAKASREARQYFGNRHGQFATRYLDRVLMGQTEPGSFVVTAYAPPDALIPYRQPPAHQQQAHYDGIDAVSARTVAQSLTRAVGAAQEAVDHARRTSNLSGFEAGVESGVSFELATALYRLTAGADEADVTIGLDPAVPVVGETQVRFEFSGADATIFSQAATRLAQPSESRQERVEGRVYLLSQADVGSAGVVAIETLTGQPAPRVRVRLPLEDYHQALYAHGESLAVAAQGRLEREGNLTWLYDARLVAVYPADDQHSIAVRAPQPPVTGQLSLDDVDLQEGEQAPPDST